MALVTGVGRTVGIGAGIASRLASSGWDIAFTYWTPYDERSANVINPGPVDTGWMTDAIRESGVRRTPLGRLGTPRDTANLVDFLCSPQGQWINGQLLLSNGGFA